MRYTRISFFTHLLFIDTEHYEGLYFFCLLPINLVNINSCHFYDGKFKTFQSCHLSVHLRNNVYIRTDIQNDHSISDIISLITIVTVLFYHILKKLVYFNKLNLRLTYLICSPKVTCTWNSRISSTPYPWW